MCEFQSLYFADDGYVVRCGKCGHYQLAFASSMLNMTEDEYKNICRAVKIKAAEPDHYNNPSAKCVVIPTASKSTCLLLTRAEAARLQEILEDADTEEKALAMLSLFRQ